MATKKLSERVSIVPLRQSVTVIYFNFASMNFRAKPIFKFGLLNSRENIF